MSSGGLYDLQWDSGAVEIGALAWARDLGSDRLAFDPEYEDWEPALGGGGLYHPPGGAYYSPVPDVPLRGDRHPLLWIWWLKWLAMVRRWRHLRAGNDRYRFKEYTVKAPLALFRLLIRRLRGRFRLTPNTDLTDRGLEENSKRRAIEDPGFTDAFLRVLYDALGGEHPSRKDYPNNPPEADIEWFMDLLDGLYSCRIHFFEMLIALADRVKATPAEGAVLSPEQEASLSRLRQAWAEIRNRLGHETANGHGGIDVGLSPREMGHPPF